MSAPLPMVRCARELRARSSVPPDERPLGVERREMNDELWARPTDGHAGEACGHYTESKPLQSLSGGGATPECARSSPDPKPSVLGDPRQSATAQLKCDHSNKHAEAQSARTLERSLCAQPLQRTSERATQRAMARPVAGFARASVYCHRVLKQVPNLASLACVVVSKYYLSK